MKMWKKDTEFELRKMFPLKTWSPASSGTLADKQMTERYIEKYEVKSRHYYEAIPNVNLVSGKENGDW